MLKFDLFSVLRSLEENMLHNEHIDTVYSRDFILKLYALCERDRSASLFHI